MKLSEAIRLGAMLRPQIVLTLHGHGSCALGAAAEAVGARVPSSLKDVEPILTGRWVFLQHTIQWPCECVTRHTLFGAIRHLNDVHSWTREQIADWVETIEPQEDATQVQRSVEVLASANIGPDAEERL